MAEEQTQQKPKRDFKKIAVIAYMALNLGAMSFGSYLVYGATVGYTYPSVTSAELDRQIASFEKTLHSQPLIYTMDTFNTNLGGLPRRLIRVSVNLEMLDAEGFEEVIDSGARSRDMIVRILNAKSFDDIESVQGKLELKNEIIASLNGILDRGVVKDVYFSDFVVQ